MKYILILLCLVSFALHGETVEWQKLLQDSTVIADKVKSSVERNRLKQLLAKIQAESQDLEIEFDNQFQLVYKQIKWQGIAEKLSKRSVSVQQNLPKGEDRALIVSILDILRQEASKNFVERPEPPKPVLVLPDEVLEARRFAIDRILSEHLPEVKKHLGNFSPSVFISYAWGPSEMPFIKRLSEQLEKAGIVVRLDVWHNGLSTAKITEFANEIEEVDYVIVVGSELYGEKYRRGKESMAYLEARVIAERYRVQPSRVLPILFSGTPKDSIPPFLRDQVYANFTFQEQYVQQLSALILALCRYSDDRAGLEKILAKINQEAVAVNQR